MISKIYNLLGKKNVLRKCSSLKWFSGSDRAHSLFMQICFLLSICNFTVSLRRARECVTCENNPHCILIFSRSPRYQSCSRAARISFLHNIRGYLRFYTFVVGNISKRSIKRLNKVWAIRFDTVISGFRKAFRRPFRRSIRVTRKIVRNLSFPHVLKATGILNNIICFTFLFFIHSVMLLTVLIFNVFFYTRF